MIKEANNSKNNSILLKVNCEKYFRFSKRGRGGGGAGLAPARISLPFLQGKIWSNDVFDPFYDPSPRVPGYARHFAVADLLRAPPPPPSKTLDPSLPLMGPRPYKAR